MEGPWGANTVQKSKKYEFGQLFLLTRAFMDALMMADEAL